MALSISDLPADVIVAVISRLSIADAVRTSILSRSWRYRWRSIPDLVFDVDDLDISAVDHVLSLHSAPIQSFSIFDSDFQIDSNDLNRWLATLSADLHPHPPPLRSLTLNLCSIVSSYSSLFSFRYLNHLHLCRWSPTGSCGLVGFPVLETLNLTECFLPEHNGGSISDLISNCPLLQKLTLQDVKCRHLRICAPNLRSFIFKGEIEDFSLASVPLLTTASIRLHEFVEEEEDDDDDEEEEELNEYAGNECNLVKAFGYVHSIEKLELANYSLLLLRKFGIPDSIPDSFERMKVLTVTIGFNIAEETLILLCLLRSAPNLHKINIKGLRFGKQVWGLSHEFWHVQNHLELPKLQTLKLTHITCVEPMLKFIDFILPKAWELKKMIINIAPGSENYGSIRKLSKSKELVRHWRASTRAKIIFTGEFLSECTIMSSGSGASSMQVSSEVWEELTRPFDERFDSIRNEELDSFRQDLRSMKNRVFREEIRRYIDEKFSVYRSFWSNLFCCAYCRDTSTIPPIHIPDTASQPASSLQPASSSQSQPLHSDHRRHRDSHVH